MNFNFPIGRGGRGIAMKLGARNETEEKDESDSSGQMRLGRGMPGRGLGLMKRVEARLAETGRGRGLVAAEPEPPVAPVGAVGRGLTASMSRLSIGRGTRSDIMSERASEAGSVSASESGDRAQGATGATGATGGSTARPGQEGRRRRGYLDPVGPEDKRGESGKRIDVTANYIRVMCEQEFVHQYNVEFRPTIDARMLRIRLLMRLQPADFCGFSSEARAFDGRILFLPRPLPEREMVIRTKRPNDNSDVLIKIVLTNKTPIVSCPPVYNIIFRRVQQELKMTQVGRHYYDPEKKVVLGNHNLEIWPGYITTITAYEGGLLLMCDVSHKVIRQDTAYDLITRILSRSQGNSAAYESECINQLVGQSVLTRYRNATYRIDDIDFKKHVKSTFLRDGKEITFASYFKEQYNIIVKDPNQPLLLHRVRKFGSQDSGRDPMICLIPELCYITGLSDQMRENFQLMKSIHQHTRVTPQVRHQAMRKFIQSVNECQRAAQILEAWGMSLESTTVSIQGRTLAPEPITFGEGKPINPGPNANFKRELGNNRVISSVPLDVWLLICTKRDKEFTMTFLNSLKARGKRSGINIENPQVITINDDRTESYMRAIRENLSEETRMVMAVFPTLRTDRYNTFKKMCCVECPVPSQAVLTKTIRDPAKLNSVATNIALQMNVKMGGELWAVRVPLKKFMVVGIDAYHHGKQRSNSVFGMCASVNHACTRYYSRAIFQDRSGQELGDKIQSIMYDILKHYHDTNNFLPDTIFFYRDGVGDSMLSTVQQHEVTQVIRGFQAFGEKYKPKVVFNVVQKRINTRIFSYDSRQMTNPNPGTIVDHTITRRDRYDFFLVPQSVNQGTVTPTHFIVLNDSSGLKPDYVQQMAYKQCHLYYNWPGTIRVPACCLYAHKLAYMVGQNIQKEPSSKLIDRLFFI